MKPNTKIFKVPFASVYPFYIAKVEKKGLTKEEVDEVITWLAGYNAKQLQKQIDDNVDFETSFDQAPEMNPSASLITGSISGVKIQEITDPLMKNVCYMDKLVDELAVGQSMDKILRK